MTWRRYAAGVMVSAGVFVTGVLWWERHNPHIAAEDIAAIMADTWERHAAMFCLTEDIADAFEEFPPSDNLAYSNSITTSRIRNDLEKIAGTWKLQFHKERGPRWLNATGCTWETGDTLLNLSYPGEWTIVHAITNNTPQGVFIGQYWNFSYDTLTNFPSILAPAFNTLEDRNVRPDNGLVLWQFGEDHDQLSGQARLIPGVDDFDLRWLDNDYHGMGEYPLDADVATWWASEDGLSTPNVYLWPNLEKGYVTSTVQYHPGYDEWITNYYESVNYYGHQIKTNTLNDFKVVVSNATIGIMVGWGSEELKYWAASSTVSASASTYIVDGGTTDVPTIDDILEQLWDEYSLDLDVTTNTYTYLYGPKLLATLGFDAQFYFNDYIPIGARTSDPYYDWIWRGCLRSVGTKFEKVHCIWPGAGVYNAGLVKRVRYYAVFTGTPCASALDSPFSTQGPPWGVLYLADQYSVLDGITNNLVFYYETDFGSETYRNDMLGLNYELSKYPDITMSCTKFIKNGITPYEIPSDMGSSRASQDLFEYGPDEWILHKLVDVENPTEAPAIDIGESYYLDSPNITIAQTSISEFVTKDFDNEWQNTQTTARWRTGQLLKLHTLICVVDFNFSNYYKGGNMVTNTPPWAAIAPALP